MSRRPTASERRAYDRGFADGYKAATRIVQRELRQEQEQRIRSLARRVFGRHP